MEEGERQWKEKMQNWKAMEGRHETQKDSELDRAVSYDWHHSKSLCCVFLTRIGVYTFLTCAPRRIIPCSGSCPMPLMVMETLELVGGKGEGEKGGVAPGQKA